MMAASEAVGFYLVDEAFSPIAATIILVDRGNV